MTQSFVVVANSNSPNRITAILEAKDFAQQASLSLQGTPK
jgi:hypothetical protein